MPSDISDNSSADDSVDDEEIRPKRKRKRKRKTRKQEDRQKQTTSTTNEQPSVYSSAEIRRHEKRLKRLRALEQGYGSESETESENENVDPDLDINLRIFESSAASTDNLIIGEIQCNVKADDKVTASDVNEKGNKNANIFKVSVNANFDENTNQMIVKQTETDGEKSEDELEKELDNILLSGDSCGVFTEDDSDLEILMSKPIVRKRAMLPTKKEKPVDESANGKRTMYDLICDAMSPRRRNDSVDEDEPDEEINESQKKKKKKNADKKIEESDGAVDEEIIEKLETTGSITNVPLAVPQLKVTADGEVVVDTDSLVVEETGISEARNAIANSELIEECGLTHRSYSKKRNLPKQWSPQDTLKFYHVLSTIGTDFSLMATLFPGRTRMCMKRKFKREEKNHADLILKALSCRQNFDLGLLEKELRINEERVNKLRENSNKTQKVTKSAKKTNEESKKKGGRKSSTKPKRRSYFETSIRSFQSSESAATGHCSKKVAGFHSIERNSCWSHLFHFEV